MLATIEAYFLSALLTLSRDSAVSLKAGPLAAGDGNQSPDGIAVWAGTLSLLGPAVDAVRGARSSVREFRRCVLTPPAGSSSSALDFVVPLDGEIGEVELSPGVPARPGDDYLLDERTLHFFRPPPGPVGVTVYGNQAPGYLSRRPCQIEVSVRISALQADRVDALLRAAVSTLLGAAAELANLEVPAPPGSAVRLRLLFPTAALTAVRRYAETPTAHGATAEWTIWGDLEETIVLGSAEPVDRIASIKYHPVGLLPKP
jgi:hypothetical protein